MKRGLFRRGLSQVVTSLIIILVSLVAIGLISLVVFNLIKSNASEIDATQLSTKISLVPENILVNGSNITVGVKREAGVGELIAVLFIVSDESNSIRYRWNGRLDELGQTSQTFSIEGLNEEKIISVIAVAIVTTSGGEKYAQQASVYDFVRKKLSTVNINSNQISKYFGGTISFDQSSSGENPQACVPDVLGEICGDGKDNDCDGGVDETGCVEIAPSNYVLELISDNHIVFSQTPTINQPTKCQSFIDPNSGNRVTLITNISEESRYNDPSTKYYYDGNPNAGLTNGYSTYANVNVNGKYAFVETTENPVLLYDLENCNYLGFLNISGPGWILKTDNARWDLSGRDGTENTLYFTRGSKFYKFDAFDKNSLEVVFDVGTVYPGATIVSEDHTDQSRDARYRAMGLSNGKVIIVDQYSGTKLTGEISGTKGQDVSPSGRWLRKGNYFYRISDLANGDTTRAVNFSTTDYGHAAWSYDKEGSEVFVFQYNSKDSIYAFIPDKNQEFKIIGTYLGSKYINQHIGLISNPSKKGWFLMSTYQCYTGSWVDNQLMMIEIKPQAENPRIWRVGSTYNKAFTSCPSETTKNFFAESFANMDPSGNNIYWGSNWFGLDNLEVYQLELPQNWEKVLSGDLPAAQCDLTSAAWSKSTANLGEGVALNVLGSNCNGKEINFTIIKKENLLGIDWLKPDKVIFGTSGSLSINWNAGLKQDGSSSVGEYYFTAKVVGETENVQSGILTVSTSSIVSAQPLVTKRFGECSTCDVTGVAKDSYVQSSSTTTNYGSASKFYIRELGGVYSPILYFDLSSIPQGAVVKKARLVIHADYGGNFNVGTTGLVKQVYKINDPSGTGIWDESTVTYAQKKSGVSWSSSGFNGAKGNKIGELYFKRWYTSFLQSYFDADITSGVQDWVNNPSTNLGLTFNGTGLNIQGAYTKETSDASLRPYLEVTYEVPSGVLNEYPNQPSGVNAKYYSGQTFITWNEINSGKDETSYKIYRHSSPITSSNINQAELIDQVYQGSSYLSDSLSKEVSSIKQPDLSKAGVSLNSNSGLYVYTVESGGNYYYAVTTVVEGNENREIVVGQNSLTSSVSESIAIPDAFFFRSDPAGNAVDGYVMWLGSFNPTDLNDEYGFDNRRSAPFFFSVAEPQNFNSANKYPLTLHLHAAGKTYFESKEQTFPSRFSSVSGKGGGYTLGFNDFHNLIVKDKDGNLKYLGKYLETDSGDSGYSYYSGWNSNYVPTLTSYGLKKTFEDTKPLNEGVNVPYTEKSMRFVINWMQTKSEWKNYIDSSRVYAEGGSLGAGGAMAFAVHNSDLVSAVNSNLGRTVAIGSGYSSYTSRYYGSMDENIQTPYGMSMYDYMDLSWYVQNNPSKDYPLIRMHNGKQDTTILWQYVPDFLRTYQNYGGLVAYWDQSTHTNSDPDGYLTFTEWKFLDRAACPNGEDSINNCWYVQTNDGFNYFYFDLDQSYISFSDFSLNGNPGNGDVSDGDSIGAINRFPWYNRSTIVDQANRYEVNLYLLDIATSSMATVSVTPRRLQNLIHTQGTNYNWQFGTQSGTVTADQNGKIKISGLHISKTSTKLIITKI